VYKDTTDAWVFAGEVNTATTTTEGVVRLATNAEAQGGTSTTSAVTPAALQSKISDSTSTTSSTTIASSTAVKAVADTVGAALPKSGGTITGILEIGNTGQLRFEGSSNDAYETTLAVEDPTATRTITLPDRNGTVITTGDTGTVATAMVANDAITYAKIQNVSATDRLLGRSSAGAGDVEEITCTAAGRALLDDVDAAAQRTTLGLGTLATQNGTFSGTSSGTNTGDQTITLTGDVTGSGTGSFAATIASGVVTSDKIADGTIVNADINASAAIAGTKISPDFGSQNLATTGDITIGDKIIHAGDTNTAIRFPANDTFSVETGGSEKLRVDDSNRLLVGTSTAVASSTGVQGGFQHQGATSAYANANLGRWVDDNNGYAIYFGKSRGTSVGTHVIVQENDSLGYLAFEGSDGTALKRAAAIFAQVDGTPGANDMPGRLVFSTTPDGSATPTERMRIDGIGRLGLGTSSPSETFHVNGNARLDGKVGIEEIGSATKLRISGDIPDDSETFSIGVNLSATASASTDNIYGFISDIRPTSTSVNTVTYIYRYNARQLNSFGSATVTNQYGFFASSDLTGATNNFGFHSGLADANGRWNFYAAGSAPNYFAGDVRIGNSAGVNITSSSSNGLRFFNDGAAYHVRSGNLSLFIGRNTNDGNLVGFYQDGINEGLISVAGSTVSYNPFLGSHWGRLVDGSKPDILPGTILDTVDQLIEWKQAKFTVDGEEKIAAYNGPAEVGDTIEIDYEGNSYSAIVQNEEEEPEELNKHVCVKVNDTASSKAVFGVFLGWDNDIPDNMVSTWNDLYCAAVGNYFVRIANGETLEIGSLIEADGNGCGIVQNDDIIRSKTVAKITSTIPQEVYDDGSFLVTCVLCCG
jgi:hypothetical protein